MLKMINIVFFFLCFATVSIGHGVDEMHTTFTDDFDLERQLKSLNKLPTENGNIVDCIDIKKQPAFDHPLLKNHKLQRNPNFKQTIIRESMNSSIIKLLKIGLEKDSCPEGTVPIQRTTKEDLIQAKSLFNAHINSADNPGFHVAEVFSTRNYISYYGVGGIGSIYNPHVSKGQSSAGYVWIQNNQTSNNKIISGWHVFPELYGDDATHFYSLWTSDNSQTKGCYNQNCHGFIQVDKKLYVGVQAAKTSVVDGDIYELPISLKKDLVSYNWWLIAVGRNVGYFPAELFPNMKEAGKVGWGGETTNTLGEASPPMGSGYFPDDNFRHASYFKQVSIRISNDGDEEWRPTKFIDTFTDAPNCFGVKYYDDLGGYYRCALQFGGPGGNCCD